MSAVSTPASVRRRFSLTVRISLGLIIAVILPLLITIISSELILRPNLTTEAISEMETDALNRQQLIDSLMIARLQDLDGLEQYYSIQQFLIGNQTYKNQAAKELELGYGLDQDYSAWTLFDTQGDLLLSYPASSSLRGGYNIPATILGKLQAPYQSQISDVYFQPALNMAYIDMYVSVTTDQGKVLGIARSTLLLNAVWEAVNNESSAANGSYAEILDEHGVRIAYTNPDTTNTTIPPTLFKAVAPLSQDFQDEITSENLYGNNDVNDKNNFDSTLASELTQGQGSYQLTPVEEAGQTYEAYQVHCQVVPWTYIELRPMDTITGAANQQDLYLLIIAVIVTLLAALAGLRIGRGMTGPILSSTVSLGKSSEMLQVFAKREQARAKEQKWIVESAQTGLKSVQYYAKASTLASAKLEEMARNFKANWERLNDEQKRQQVHEILSAAAYIKKASSHEERSSAGLSTAIQVTNQVAEQLLSGAASASEAATQLEAVIKQLRDIVGE